MLEDRTVQIESWDTPASAYPRAREPGNRVGKACFGGCTYGRGFYELYHVPAPDGERRPYYHVNKPIRVRSLKIANKVWMVDDPAHWWAMLDHASHLRGDVLCAGLGLGLMVHALRLRPDVERITVVERCRDVIDLLSPLLGNSGPRLNIVESDWEHYRHDRQPDGVLYDLFVGDARDLIGYAYREAAAIRERYPKAVMRVHGFNSENLKNFLDARDAMEVEILAKIGERDPARVKEIKRLTQRRRGVRV